MSYRVLLMAFLLLTAGLGCSVPEESTESDEPMPEVTGPKTPPEREEPLAKDFPLRAVSLRALQQTLETCTQNKTCTEEVLELGRITRPLGYVLDPEERDVVIYGLADPKLPRLHVEDFVVALRSSWLKYARRDGNTYHYTYPGCDIRPRPDNVLRLQEVGQRLFSSSTPEQTEGVLQDWRQTCELPQAVTVLGVPFDTHFGQVMVKADYDMKRLADGTDALDIPGLTSMMDLELGAVEAAVRQRRPVSLKAGMNRFWLTRSDQVYTEVDGITWMHSSPVRIQTNPIAANTGGELSDTAGADPAAEDFAHRFSALYAKVAERRPVYSELRGLFQVFALTQLLRHQNALQHVGLDLSYLLDTYPVPTVPVEREVPGRQAVRRFRHEREIKDGSEIIQLWMPSCGGVEMPIEPSSDGVQSNVSDRRNAVQNRVRGARFASNPGVWNVSPVDLEALRHGVELEGMNQHGSPLFARVEDQGTQYQLFSHGATYEGLDTGVLLKNLLPVAERQGTQTIYLDLSSFSPKKAETFSQDCRLRLKQLSKNIEIRFLLGAKGSALVKSLFSPGIRVVKTRPAQLATEGRFKGLYVGLITFLVQIGEKLFEVTVSIVGSSAVMVNGFMGRFGMPFDVSGSFPLSAIHRFDQTRREMAQEVEDLLDDLLIIIKDEVGNSHYVDLAVPGRHERAA